MSFFFVRFFRTSFCPLVLMFLVSVSPVGAAKKADATPPPPPVRTVLTDEDHRIIRASMALVDGVQSGEFTEAAYKRIVQEHGLTPEHPFMSAIYARVLPFVPVLSLGSTATLRARVILKSLFYSIPGLFFGVPGGLLVANLRGYNSYDYEAVTQHRIAGAGVGLIGGFFLAQVLMARAAAGSLGRIRLARSAAEKFVAKSLLESSPEYGLAALLEYGKVVDDARLSLDAASRTFLAFTLKRDERSVGHAR